MLVNFNSHFKRTGAFNLSTSSNVSNYLVRKKMLFFNFTIGGLTRKHFQIVPPRINQNILGYQIGGYLKVFIEIVRNKYHTEIV